MTGLTRLFAMRFPIGLDRDSHQPLVTQLTERLREAIRDGRLPAGARLPSSRALADQLGLSRNTVVRACEAIVAEGLAESRAASGLFVTNAASRRSFRPQHVATADADASAVRAALPVPLPVRASVIAEGGRPRVSFDFAPGRPSAELFPV
jgi:GntR family transcriptional regulator/MocR family aminotransferase